VSLAQNRRPELLIIGAAVLWGLIGPFSVWAAREGLTAAETSFWRTAMTSLPFMLLTRLTRTRIPPGREVAGIAGFGVFGIAVMYVAFFTAVQRSGAGIAAVLLYTGPAWVGIFEWTAARRLPAWSSLSALLLTIAGVVLLSFNPNDIDAVDGLGVLAGLLSGVAYATHFTIGRKYITRHGSAVVYALAMAVAALVIAPIARPSLPPTSAIIPLLYLSVIATFVASLLFARGVVQVPPVRAAITATIEPVVATAASILVLGASLHPQQLAGAGLVLTGVTMIMQRTKSPSSSPL
jgi:drug/metabolite transporter (DMT)-like permease